MRVTVKSEPVKKVLNGLQYAQTSQYPTPALDDWWYKATCPEVPGAVAYAECREDAVRLLKQRLPIEIDRARGAVEVTVDIDP